MGAAGWIIATTTLTAHLEVTVAELAPVVATDPANVFTGGVRQ